ncbi:MAG TPA: transglutaminase-like domain-containing protein [Nitriliruptorales bacterium]|nr:transglutaminase-like domain-containing protein [Nitriliruptorales bacterium]
MSEASRQRLATIADDPACDLAEAALLCCVEVQPELDVAAGLRRIDVLADGLRATGFRPESRYAPDGRGGSAQAATSDALALAGWLAGELGFSGDPTGPHDPRNGLLTAVLDRRRGWSITLAIVYIAVARRLSLRAFGVDAPSPLLVGVGGGASEDPATRPAVVDPFHAGALLDDRMIAARVHEATDGQVDYAPGMLRPVRPLVVIRRLLNDLTRAYLAQADLRSALWTVELRRRLPGSGPSDVRTAGQLLARLGRYRQSAETLEAYLSAVGGDPEVAAQAGGPELAAMARIARRARAKMN